MWINTLSLTPHSCTKNMNVFWDLRKLKKKKYVSYIFNYSVYLSLGQYIWTESIYLDYIKPLSASLRLSLLDKKVVLYYFKAILQNYCHLFKCKATYLIL